MILLDMEYSKVRAVAALPGKRLRVTCDDGSIRVYDCGPLLAEEPFKLLANEAFFRAVQADAHGYGISWSDDVDLAESELWLNGVPETAS